MRFGSVALALVLLACSVPAPHIAGLERGSDKRSAIQAIGELGVGELALDPYPIVTATRPSEVERLQSAEGIILGGGQVRIGFEQDRVQYVVVAPVYPELAAAFSGVATRADALAAIRQVLENRTDLTFRSCAFRNTRIRTAATDPSTSNLLDRYDQWSGSYTNWFGYWYVTVRFDDGKVAAVQRRWSPAPK